MMEGYTTQQHKDDLMDFAVGAGGQKTADSHTQYGDPTGGENQNSAPAFGAPQPYPNELLAKIFTQLAATGLPESKIEKFKKEYGDQLLELFNAFEFNEGLADVGVTMGGSGNPTWLRLAGGLGSVAVLTFIHRPKLIAQWLQVIRPRKKFAENSDDYDPEHDRADDESEFM